MTGPIPDIRPEIRAALRRWREVLAGLAVALAGGWIFGRGGLFFQPLGAVIAAAGLGLTVQGLRRLRFRRPVAGAGVVDVLEGQISYLSPEAGRGGFVAIPEIVELRLISRAAERIWRIVPETGPALLIPADALGADRLFDIFAALPGLDMTALLAALEAEPPPEAATRVQPIWRRPLRVAASEPRV